MSPLMLLADLATLSDFSERLLRLATFQDYNTWIPLLATAILGGSAGVVGVFTVLRGRALIGDVVGHAALPGIVGAFLLLEAATAGSGRSTPVLMAGALLSGAVGAGCVLLISRYSRIKPDAALAIVLSVFYGAGAVLLSAAQRLDAGSQVGLRDYLSGKAASLVGADVWISAGLALALLVVTLALFKEWALLCFDDAFAAVTGRPVLLLDGLLVLLVAIVAIIGMKSVGLVLVSALLIIPAAAARFWTDDLRRMAAIAGAVGALSGAGGVAISALGPRLAAGPVIVLTGAGMFVLSLVFGRRRGLLWRRLQRRQLQRQHDRQEILRSWHEFTQTRLGRPPAGDDLMQTQLRPEQLAAGRPQLGKRLPRVLRSMQQAGDLRADDEGWALTESGANATLQSMRNRRLWELYLIEFADIAPAHAHRNADNIEDVLDAETLRELGRLLRERCPE